MRSPIAWWPRAVDHCRSQTTRSNALLQDGRGPADNRQSAARARSTTLDARGPLAGRASHKLARRQRDGAYFSKLLRPRKRPPSALRSRSGCCCQLAIRARESESVQRGFVSRGRSLILSLRSVNRLSPIITSRFLVVITPSSYILILSCFVPSTYESLLYAHCSLVFYYHSSSFLPSCE